MEHSVLVYFFETKRLTKWRLEHFSSLIHLGLVVLSAKTEAI